MSIRTPEFDETRPAAGIDQQPTNVRWGVLGFTVVMSVLLYLDRFAIGVATPTIMKDLGLDESQIAPAKWAFFFTYALSQVPAGWLSNRFGARRMLSFYVAAWSLALAGMSLAGGLFVLMLMRSLLGIFQAGAYPTAAGIVKHWMPLERRGVANGSVAMGGRAGGVLASVVTAQLMAALVAYVVSNSEWRSVFILYGGLGLLWAALFYRWYRDRPGEHPRCNPAECELIAHGQTTSRSARDRREPLPWKKVLTSRNMFFLCAANVLVNAGWIFLFEWLSTYLDKVHHFDIKSNGWLTALPALAGMGGCVAGGASTDFLVHRVGLSWGRRLPAVSAGIICAILYAGVAYATYYGLAGPYTIIGVLTVASFLTDLGLGALWATYQDIGGAHVAPILGFANMCGNLSAALFIEVYGRLAKHGQWHWIFIISSVSFVLTVLSWLFIDPRVPFVPVEGDKEGTKR